MAALHHLFLCIPIICAIGFASASPLCLPQSRLFLNTLQSQCPISVSPSVPTEVDGESLDKALRSSQGNAYTSVLFHASWCPFSRNAQSTFNILSAMFPKIRHVMVEESSVLPVVFSKYGVHGLPTILIANQTSRIRYYGLKDLNSLVRFYKRTTGYDPVEYFIDHQPSSLGSDEVPPLWEGSPREILKRGPYLVLSLLFLCVKALVFFFPEIFSRLKAVWVMYVRHINLSFFGAMSQLSERVLHVIDMKRAWSKRKLCKTRNFQNGAKNARVWATLASVSLGESSSTRSATLDS